MLKIHASLIAVAYILTSMLVTAEEKLSDYISGFKTSHEMIVVLGDKSDETNLFIPSYLAQLKLKDEANTIPATLHYKLWRHFLDCHHLCQVLYHQSYYISEELPICDLLEHAFPGFKKAARAEGGIWINRGYDFLQTVDPFEKARKEALSSPDK